jgi:CRP/FNR family putative post-exponential-phase nitrogen-starvation transcriptional regulator
VQILSEPLRSQYIDLYSIQPFSSFSIKPSIQVHQFNRGEFIFKEGSIPEYLYLIVEGKAKLYITHENGKVSLLNFVEAPSLIGELELLGVEQYSIGVQTSTKTICLAIPMHICKSQLLEDPVFLRHLSIFLSKKTHHLSFKSVQTQIYPLENRLASFILMSAEKDFYKEKHTEVSEYLGVSYRHLLHVISQFCKASLIKKHERGYLILDRERLQQLAKID